MGVLRSARCAAGTTRVSSAPTTANVANTQKIELVLRLAPISRPPITGPPTPPSLPNPAHQATPAPRTLVR